MCLLNFAFKLELYLCNLKQELLCKCFRYRPADDLIIEWEQNILDFGVKRPYRL